MKRCFYSIAVIAGGLVLVLALAQVAHAQFGGKKRYDYFEPDFLYRSAVDVKVTPYNPDEIKDKIIYATNNEDPQVEYTLGYMYQHGNGVYKSYRKAERWYEEAAKGGYLPAMVALGRLYKLGGEGEEIPRTVTTSIKWFHTAAKQKYYPAWYELGILYESGDGVFQNDKKAFSWYLGAARAGIVNAQIKVGLFYQHGRGVQKDLRRAIEYFEQAGETDGEEVQLHISRLLGGVYGEIAGSQNDEEEKIKWLTLAAELGDMKSQVVVGNAYRDGKGVWRDYEQAIKWYKLAAEKESVEAMYNIGDIYNNGLGQEVNVSEALKWYIAAAERGSSEAAWNIGSMYFDGRGVERDEAEANKWFSRAEVLRSRENGER